MFRTTGIICKDIQRCPVLEKRLEFCCASEALMVFLNYYKDAVIGKGGIGYLQNFSFLKKKKSAS